jgi:hypothetical protein
MFSCKENDIVNPPIVKTGKQIDINWPSLAMSPWPMHHGNPQSTGRFNGKGPNGIVEWDYNTDGPVYTSVVIGEDSSIYFLSHDIFEGKTYLHALSSNGTIKYKKHIRSDTTGIIEFVETTPIITNDGTIYIGSTDSYIYALNMNGNEKWKFKSGGKIFTIGMNIGKDGVLYFVANDGYLYSLNADGNLLWKVREGSGFEYSSTVGISFSPNGQTLYVGTRDGKLAAVNIDGTITWQYDAAPNTTPAIDNDGNLFFSVFSTITGKSGFYSLNSNGNERWVIYGNPGGFFEPTIDYDGNVYFLMSHKLISVANDGNIRWEYSQISTTASISLVSDRNNVIYVAGYDTLWAFDNNGSCKFTVPLAADCVNSPAFLPTGNLIVPTWYKNKSVFSIL